MDADQLFAEARSAGPPAPGARPGISLTSRQGFVLVASGQTAVGDDGKLIAQGGSGPMSGWMSPAGVPGSAR